MTDRELLQKAALTLEHGWQGTGTVEAISLAREIWEYLVRAGTPHTPEFDPLHTAYQLAPKAPDKKMIDAGMEAFYASRTQYVAKPIYLAMLAAARGEE